MRPDVDDAGTLARVNALADKNECKLIGVINSRTGLYIVGAINAINSWYGRENTPVELGPEDDQRWPDH